MVDLLARAKALAEDIHKGETDRLGIAYIWHVADVAARCRQHGDRIEIIAWLHDVIESSPEQQRVAMRDRIEQDYGKDIQDAVWALTRLEAPFLPEKEAFHAGYMQRVLANDAARKVKAADLSHNISKLQLMQDDARYPVLLDQYGKALQMLDIPPESVTRPIRFVDNKGWLSGMQNLWKPV